MPALIFDPSVDYPESQMSNMNWLNFKPFFTEYNALRLPIERHYSFDDGQDSVHVPLPAQCKLVNGHNYTDDLSEQLQTLAIGSEPAPQDSMRFRGTYESIGYDENDQIIVSAYEKEPSASVPYLRVDTTDLLYQRSDKRIFATSIVLKSITPKQMDSAIEIAQFFEKMGYGRRKNATARNGLNPLLTNPPPLWAVWVNSGYKPSIRGHSNFFVRLNHAFMLNCTTTTQGVGQDTPYSINRSDTTNGPLVVNIQLAFSEVQSAYRSSDGMLQNRSSMTSLGFSFF